MQSPALQLRPATLEALASFRKRRRKLLFQRAGIAAATMLLVLLLIVALLDRATFMPESLRKALSYSGYLGAAIAAWWLALRFVREANDEFSTAKLMENADPALHEKLLAAVELANGGRENDSREFRARLQDEVATQLTGFQADHVLPNRLLRPWIAGATGTVAVLIGLSLIPSLHLPGFMARAALPFANLARPSSVKIQIATPVNPNTTVPIASTIPFGVQITGTTPERVLIELQTSGGKPSRQELSDSGKGRFDTSIHIGQTDVRYRVIAADAITAWYTMTARPRPRILEFTRTIIPPAYAELEPQTSTFETGDIAALEGSTVKLTLKANQALAQNVATLSPDAHKIPVEQSRPDTLNLSLSMDGKSDAWQLSLTAQETGFTNEETTPWRIESIPDLPPTATILTPNEQREVRSDDAIQITGNATDDLGLAKVELSFAINGTDWKDSLVQGKSGKESAVNTEFKLAPLPVKTGDSILLKLIATDLKGQRAESSPLRLFIVEDKLNVALRQWSAQQRQLAQQAKSLAEEARDMRKEAERARKIAKADKNEDEAQAEASMARLKQNLSSIQEKSDELWAQLKASAQKAPNVLKAQEMNAVGQRLAEMRGDHLKELQQQVKAEQTDQNQMKTAANETANDAQMIAEALRTFAAADTAEAVREAFDQLAPQQMRLADKSIDANRNPAERPKWQEQQRAALAAAENAQKDLEALQETIHDGRKHEVKNQLENLSKKLPGVQNVLDRDDQKQSPEFIYGQAHELRNAANNARDASRWMAEESAQKASEMRERLMQHQNSALTTLDQARQQTERAISQKKEKPDAEPAKNQAADKLTAAARQFKDQSELREQNAQTNTQAALDMNRMGRALENLADQVKRAETPEELKTSLEKARQLSDAARALQADAAAQDATQALQESKEAATSQTSAQDQLPAAQAAASQLKNLPNLMRQARAENQAADAAQQAANLANWQKDEVQNQQRFAADMKRSGQEAPAISPEQNRALEANQKTQTELTKAMESFAPKVAEARQQLEQMTPSLSELAQNAAAQLRETQQQTSQAAQSANKDQAAEQTSQAANALLPKASEDAQKLADLQAALRQESAKADLAKLADRQMARTADVGLAQMQQQTPQIAANLQQAAQSQQAPQQAQALENAAKAQQQTANALDQLAQNLEKMEKGETLPEDALAAQKAMEEALGIKEALDESYQQAQNIAELMEKAKGDPQQALAALEQELQKNSAMKRALGNLAEQTASDTQKALEQAQNQPLLAQPTAQESAHELSRVARHTGRLGQQEAAKKVSDASQRIEKMAQAAKADPTQNNPHTAEQATQSAKVAQEAASSAAKASGESSAPAASLFEAAKGAMLAQALDQLDQAVNPRQSTPEEGQTSQAEPQKGQQQGQPQTAQKNAQQSLAQAKEAQAQSMAQDRAQGLTPGQKPPAQTAQNQGQPQQAASQASPDAMGNIKQGAPNLIVPMLEGAQGGDWGHLPSRMAKDLTEASRQEPSPEYRAAIESYYKAIAEKARK